MSTRHPVHERFAFRLRQILDKSDADRSIKAAAAELNITYDVLYSRLSGRSRFNIEEMITLVRYTGDGHLASSMLEDAGFFASEKLDVPQSDEDTVHSTAAAEAVIRCTRVLETVLEALSDQVIDAREREIILSEIAHSEQALASLRGLIETR
jgi:hypothetical protein